MLDIYTLEASERESVLDDLVNDIDMAITRVVSDQRARLEVAGLTMFAYRLRQELTEVLVDARDDASVA